MSAVCVYVCDKSGGSPACPITGLCSRGTVSRIYYKSLRLAPMVTMTHACVDTLEWGAFRLEGNDAVDQIRNHYDSFLNIFRYLKQSYFVEKLIQVSSGKR